MNIKRAHVTPSWKFFVRIFSLWIKDAVTPIQRTTEHDPVDFNSDEIKVWKVGHACLLINFYGTSILTDPILVDWLPIPKRVVGPGLTFEQLPDHLDYIVISHAHMDHLNLPTLKKLAHKTGTLLMAKNTSDLVEGFGYKKVVELEWDKPYVDGEFTFLGVKPEHWGQRVPWEKMVRYYNATIISKNGKNIFFGGDSGYGPFFKSVGEKFKEFELAIIGIGAYYPETLEKSHKTPEQAVQATVDINAKAMVPMHYGFFRLSLEPMDEPPKRLMEEAERRKIEHLFHVLEPGKSYTCK